VFQQPSPSIAQQKAEALFHRHYGHLMKKAGAGFVTFDNTAPSGWRIVDRLLGPPFEDVSLLLQDEILVLRRSLHETYAGRRLYDDLVARYVVKPRGQDMSSDSTGDRVKIQAELERFQLLQPQVLRSSRSQNTREPLSFAVCAITLFSAGVCY
jgi:hypothetical protein